MLAKARRLAQLQAQLNVSNGRTTGNMAGLTLSSHFQPIYSLSHSRVVGQEALLRAHDAGGQSVPPPQVFAKCKTPEELGWCDSLSRVMHMANFAAVMPPAQWLFLNVHPDTSQLLFRKEGQEYVREVLSHVGLTADRIVLEVLESAVGDASELEESVSTVREQGCLIAIDDFGAGHSNFDRVWRLKPDIVKLDRSLVARAARDGRSRRVVAQMVALLHECGAMVLLEGVETLDEALLAMEADADMVQGYFFARPQADLVPSGHCPDNLAGLHAGFQNMRQAQQRDRQEMLAPYRNAIGHAGVSLSMGHSVGNACRSFMGLPATELCYVLDANGRQIDQPVWSTQLLAPSSRQAYTPMNDSHGASWARRPYFRRAIEAPGKVQVTRPYRTLNGNHTCVTVSYGFHVQTGQGKETRVVCGDIIWDGLT